MLQALLLLTPSVLVTASVSTLPTQGGEQSATLAEETPLELSLAALSPDKLRADLRFLASDSMRGRDTPSAELRLAAMFLGVRVERLGFTAGAEDGWFYDYPLHSARLDGQASFVELLSGESSLRLEFGQDYFFSRASQAYDSSLEAGVVCVGAATKDEIAQVEVDGRWALVLDSGRVLRKAVERSLEAGALGVIATPGPRYKRDSYPEKFEKRAAAMLEDSSPRMSPRKLDQGPPLVLLRREAAARMFALATNDWDGDFPPVGHDLGLSVQEERKMILQETPVSNVCAFWPGSDPVLAKEVMIVSAHYDHVGERRGEIYNGADDNASGTTGLLALADALQAYGPLKRSVLLLWVSGEEKGLWGSQVWTKTPWLPEGCRPVLDINMDMIGRTESDELYITPSRDHRAFNSLSETGYRLAQSEGFAELQSQDEYWRRSDHMNFHDNLEIPVIFLSSGDHPDYHKPTDTFEKINYEKMCRVVRLVVRILDAMQDATLEE